MSPLFEIFTATHRLVITVITESHDDGKLNTLHVSSPWVSTTIFFWLQNHESISYLSPFPASKLSYLKLNLLFLDFDSRTSLRWSLPPKQSVCPSLMSLLTNLLLNFQIFGLKLFVENSPDQIPNSPKFSTIRSPFRGNHPITPHVRVMPRSNFMFVFVYCLCSSVSICHCVFTCFSVLFLCDLCLMFVWLNVIPHVTHFYVFLLFICQNVSVFWSCVHTSTCLSYLSCPSSLLVVTVKYVLCFTVSVYHCVPVHQC
jgi:hypothetical protein